MSQNNKEIKILETTKPQLDPEEIALQEVSSFLIHKLRNPLGGIKGFAALLERDLSDQPEKKKIASMIVKGTDHLNDLMGVILEFTEPLVLKPQTIDILPLLKEISDHPRIQFSTNSDSLTMFADPTELRKALSSLIVYSFDSMQEKGNLEISAVVSPTEIVLTFEDEGMGINQERLSKVFSPFFTAPCGGNEGDLAQVKKIVRAHGGSIEVFSIEEKSTKFIITLPIKRG